MAYIEADYAYDESKKQLTTDEQYKAAVALVKMALIDMTNVDAVEIEATKDGIHRYWWRLKIKNAPASSYRAIVEITETDVILHLVIPRASDTYAEVKKLWETHRQRLPQE